MPVTATPMTRDAPRDGRNPLTETAAHSAAVAATTAIRMERATATGLYSSRPFIRMPAMPR